MEFQDVWNIKQKSASKIGPTKDDHVAGHAEGDHTYCSASNCKVAQRCIDNKHDQCSAETCSRRADHHAGMHNLCSSSWCKIAQAEEDAFYLAINAASSAGTLDTFNWDPIKYLTTEPDDSDDNIINDSKQKEQHEAGDHSICSVKYCDITKNRKLLEGLLELDGGQ